MGRVMHAWAALAFVGLIGCAEDKTKEAESDVTTRQPAATGGSTGSDVTTREPATGGPSAGSDVTVQRPAMSDAGGPLAASGASAGSEVTVRPPAENDAGGPATLRDSGTGSAQPPTGADAMPATRAGDGDYSPIACSDAVPQGDPAYPACDGTIRCGGEARCIPNHILAASAGAEQFGMFPVCSGGKCVPVAYRQGRFAFKPCAGELGDGRCVALCAAFMRNPLSSFLKKGAFGCGREEVCGPCSVDGEQTELCATDMCAE